MNSPLRSTKAEEMKKRNRTGQRVTIRDSADFGDVPNTVESLLDHRIGSSSFLLLPIASGALNGVELNRA